MSSINVMNLAASEWIYSTGVSQILCAIRLENIPEQYPKNVTDNTISIAADLSTPSVFGQSVINYFGLLQKEIQNPNYEPAYDVQDDIGFWKKPLILKIFESYVQYQEDIQEIMPDIIAFNNLTEIPDTCEVKDPIFGDVQTASIVRTINGWVGWIPNVPKVGKCVEKTKENLLASLVDKLRQVLEAEEEEWDKKFEDALKNGNFESLREEALEDVKTGRFTYV